MLIYCAQYINQAFKFVGFLAFQMILKEHYHMGPTKTAVYVSIFWLPWATKLLYGILFDSVPIFGSRKKSWMILMSLIVVLTTLVVTFIDFENPRTLLLILTISNAANAGADVIVDALMVMQAKRDPINGS